jgi:hypothetical protein
MGLVLVLTPGFLLQPGRGIRLVVVVAVVAPVVYVGHW